METRRQPIFTHNNYWAGPDVRPEMALHQLDQFEATGVKQEHVASAMSGALTIARRMSQCNWLNGGVCGFRSSHTPAAMGK